MDKTKAKKVMSGEATGISSETPSELTETTTTPEPTPDTGEKVEVSQGLLEGMNKRMKELEKTNAILLEVADKKRLSQHYQRNQGDIPKVIKLRSINGRVIIGWGDMIVNEVFKDSSTMRWGEKQEVKLIFEDGKSQKMAFLDYTRQYKYIEAKVLSRSTNEENGEVILKVERLDNKQNYEISTLFVN